jgi:two-component system, chemotaxis family, CheB/CheR fusion protein
MRSVSDLTNLKNSTQIATIILDIRDFTPPMTGLLHLREADRGCPVTDLVSRLDYGNLQEDASRVIRDLASIEHEIAVKDRDSRFLMRMLPTAPSTTSSTASS